MKSPIRCFAATVALSLAAVNAQAAAQYYNVDFETLPNGPIKLTNATATPTGTGWILAGDALDIGSQSYSDVKFVGQWMFDASTAFSYQGGGVWTSNDGNFWQVASPDGFIPAGNISPVPFSRTSARSTSRRRLTRTPIIISSS